MAKETDVARPRVDLKSGRGRGGRDEPVDYQRQADLCRCQDSACHSRNLEPSDCLKPIKPELATGARRMALNRSTDNLNFTRENGVADSSPAAYCFCRTESAEHRQQA